MQAMQSLVKARAVADGCRCVCMGLSIQSKHASLRLGRALFLMQHCTCPPSQQFLSDFYRAPELSSTFLHQWKNRPAGTRTPVCAFSFKAYSAYYGRSTVESVVSVFILKIFKLKFKLPMLQYSCLYGYENLTASTHHSVLTIWLTAHQSGK